MNYIYNNNNNNNKKAKTLKNEINGCQPCTRVCEQINVHMLYLIAKNVDKMF